MEEGRFRSAQTGPLSNDAALYQVFEWPSPGAFQFTRGSLPQNLPAYEAREVLPLMLEGMRRYDELQQYRSTLPDDSKLKAKATHPSPMPEEKDGLLFRDLWTAVRSGATPKECDAAVRVDSYRVRRLLVHWLDSGAIVVE
jgi:hypothetical protein